MFIRNNPAVLRAALVVLVFFVFGSNTTARVPDSHTTRIVSLVPGLTETCFAIGAGQQVVGVSDYCQYPEEAKSRPRVGGLGNPRLEQLLLLKPTIVLLYRSQADFAEKLRELKVDCRLFTIDRLSDVYDTTMQLGALTGQQKSAGELVTAMHSKLEAIRTRHIATTQPLALVLISRDPTDLRNLYQAGPQNFLGEILQIAGGQLAISSGAAVTKEQIILSNPEVIIDCSGGESAGNAAAKDNALQTWNQLSTVRAVKDGRVFYPSDPHALVPGPYLTTVAEHFEQMLH